MTSYVDDNVFPKVLISDPGAPSTPASGVIALYVDPADDHLKYKDDAGVVVDITAGLGGGGGTTSLVAAVAGTDGTTATGFTGTYQAFGTPWITGNIVLAATTDVLIEVQAAWLNSFDTTTFWGIFRSGTQIFNTGQFYDTLGASYVHTTSFNWVDKALAAGTYTYEVRCGHSDNPTTTLKHAVVTTPAVGAKGCSMLSVSTAANV